MADTETEGRTDVDTDTEERTADVDADERTDVDTEERTADVDADERTARAGAERIDASTTRGEGSLTTTEDLHLRSYDHQTAYDLTVEIVDSDGETVFEERYYLQPGDAESEDEAVPGGEYEVSVTVDNDRRQSMDCHVGAAAAHTAVVEVGNGTVSLTEGLQR